MILLLENGDKSKNTIFEIEKMNLEIWKKFCLKLQRRLKKSWRMTDMQWPYFPSLKLFLDFTKVTKISCIFAGYL